MKTEEELEEEAIRAAHKAWDNQVMLPFTYCSFCPPSEGKQHCVCCISTGEAICMRHWVMRKLDKLKEENKPKLDTDDFART